MLRNLFTKKGIQSVRYQCKYPEEFVMWLYRRKHPFVLQPNNLWLNIDDGKRYPFYFVYDYWITNIKK